MSSVDSDNWVLYKNRTEWGDLTPEPQDDGPNPVVAIAYSAKFEDVHNYLRALLKKNEKSQRALELTKDAVELNAANYTVWQYRRDILKALGTGIEEELDYVEEAIENSPKNYQVWHHRRVLVEWTNDPSKELQLTANILEQDPKNYHAWQHRQWVIKQFNLFDREMEFVDNLISQDVRNNSAWNERYFVMNNHVGWADINVQREIAYTIEKIKFVKNNESSWNYLRGILKKDKRGIDGNALVLNFCEELYKTKNTSPYLLGFLVDVCFEMVRKGTPNGLYNADRARGLCILLAEKFDKIRAKYWNYMAERIRKADEVNKQNGDHNEEALMDL